MRLNKGVKVPHVSLTLGILFGLMTTVYYYLFASSLGIDFQINYLAARASRGGQSVIGLQPFPNIDIVYQYPPTMTLFFQLFTIFPNWTTALYAQTAVSLVLIGLIGYTLTEFIETRSEKFTRREKVLVFVFLYMSTPTVMTLAVGQMNFYLLALFIFGYLYLEQDQQIKGGIAFATAAMIKIFPALIGIWLIRRRASRAILSAFVTGVSLVLVGVLAFGVSSQIEHINLLTSSRLGSPFQGGLPPSSHLLTLRRALSNLFPHISSLQLTMITGLCLSPVLGILYYRSGGELDDAAVYLGTIITIILFIPSNRHYVVFIMFPLLPLCFLTDIPRIRYAYAVGTAIVTIPPVRPLHVVQILDILQIPSPLAEWVVRLVTGILTFGTIPFYGLAIILLTVVYHHRYLTAVSGDASV